MGITYREFVKLHTNDFTGAMPQRIKKIAAMWRKLPDSKKANKANTKKRKTKRKRKTKKKTKKKAKKRKTKKKRKTRKRR